MRNAEKKKVEETKKSGSSGSVYEPTLFYYHDMSFLDEVAEMREIQESVPSSSITEGICSCESVISPVQKQLLETESNTSKRRRAHTKGILSKNCEKYNNAIDTVLHSLQEKEEGDVFDIFSKSIAVQLKKLPEIESTKIMGEIQLLVSNYTAEILLGRRHSSATSTPASSSPLYSPNVENLISTVRLINVIKFFE